MATALHLHPNTIKYRLNELKPFPRPGVGRRGPCRGAPPRRPRAPAAACRACHRGDGAPSGNDAGGRDPVQDRTGPPPSTKPPVLMGARRDADAQPSIGTGRAHGADSNTPSRRVSAGCPPPASRRGRVWADPRIAGPGLSCRTLAYPHACPRTWPGPRAPECHRRWCC